MPKDTATPQQTPDKTPAVDLLVKFLKNNDIVLIVDAPEKVTKDESDLLYTVNRTKRLRAFYKDQLNEDKGNGKANV